MSSEREESTEPTKKVRASIEIPEAKETVGKTQPIPEPEFKFEALPSQGLGVMKVAVLLPNGERANAIISAATTVDAILSSFFDGKSCEQRVHGLEALQTSGERVILPRGEPIMPLLDFLRSAELVVVILMRVE